jgi:DNA integrity scanning protein DisA with diadenylate cyclase activity
MKKLSQSKSFINGFIFKGRFDILNQIEKLIVQFLELLKHEIFIFFKKRSKKLMRKQGENFEFFCLLQLGLNSTNIY